MPLGSNLYFFGFFLTQVILLSGLNNKYFICIFVSGLNYSFLLHRSSSSSINLSILEVLYLDAKLLEINKRRSKLMSDFILKNSFKNIYNNNNKNKLRALREHHILCSKKTNRCLHSLSNLE